MLIVVPGNRPQGLLGTRRLGLSLPTTSRLYPGATCRQGLGSSQHLLESWGDVIAVQGTFQKQRAWCLFNTWLPRSTEACGLLAWATAEPGSSVCTSISHTQHSLYGPSPLESSFTQHTKCTGPPCSASPSGTGQWCAAPAQGRLGEPSDSSCRAACSLQVFPAPSQSLLIGKPWSSQG